MKRGEFIKTCGSICLSASAASLLLQSCGGVYYATHTLDNNIIKLSKSEFLGERKGQTLQHPFVVVRNVHMPFPIGVYMNEGQVTALLLKCTHQGCEINPNPYALVCPCHGSEFDTKGNVINPPAEERLTSYDISMDDDNYYIHLK